MVKITYAKTIFSKPIYIKEREYYILKSALTKAPDYNIDPNQESFLKHFRSRFILIGIGIICTWGSTLFVGSWIEVMFVFIGLSLVIGFTLNILLEASSYLEYLSDKKRYYKKMREAIINTKDYKEFVTVFYDIF